MTNKKVTYPKPMSFGAIVFWTGLFAGVFWSLIGVIADLLGFTDIPVRVLIESWNVGDWKKDWIGTLISIILIGVLSIGAAFIYSSTLKRLKGIWTGIVYGVILFLLVFFVLNPFFPGIAPIDKLSRNTIITSICLYIDYGIFIGYTISYEYTIKKAANEEPAT